MGGNSYQFDVEHDIITIIVQGERDAPSAQAAADGILAYKRYVANPTEGSKIIVDFRQVTNVSDQAIDAIVSANQSLNFSAMAVVRHNNWQRTFVDLIIAGSGKAGRYKTFDNLDDAQDWLISLDSARDSFYTQ